MSKHSVVELEDRDQLSDPLTDLLRAGAKQLIHQAIEAELQDFMVQFSGTRTEDGKAGVIRAYSGRT